MIQLCRASLAKDCLLEFMRHCWMRKSSPLIVGKHTAEICAAIDEAIELYRQGISSYLDIVVPFRHGKSDISSRYLPAYFLGHFPDDEIIQASYGATLSEGFSKDVKTIMMSHAYLEIFDAELDGQSNNTAERHIKGHTGKYFAVGADGGATGKGANLLIIDDFLKNRKEAEAKTIRETRWESFSQDFFSRLAPVHICLVLNTRWHVDDISGNIHNRNNPEHADYNPEFPIFKKFHYKARQDDGSYLFTERFDESWYRRQFATLGDYGASALLQGEPTLRGGNMLNVENVKIVDTMPDNIAWVRFWDLASTEKERAKDDPDYTAGAKVGVLNIDGLYHLFIDDIRVCQSEAPERDKLITSAAESDGQAVWQGVEAVAGYKDAYTTLKKLLKGKSIVYKCKVNSDKVVRAGEVEPLFDAGHVYMRKAYWNNAALEQLGEFPAAIHDDIVDAITGGYQLAIERYNKLGRLGGGQLGQGAI